MMQEHPFAQYVRVLGKGRHGSRALSQQEAYEAMRLILTNEAQPIQIGAFLMLMRVKEETPEEVAGFVQAVRTTLTVPANVQVDVDWSSYAGKRRQLPWFILAALLLAENGIKVFMHGTEGHTPGRIYTRETLQALGIPVASSLEDAAAQLAATNFAYLPLALLSPKLQDIIELRPLLGLRSPVHTVARMINPFQAPYLVQGIFHPGYRDIHQQAALALGQPYAAVFKGEGGEFERNPDQPCLVKTVREGVLAEEEWPALFKGPRHLKDETMDVRRLATLWRGEMEDEYAVATITGTAAIILKMMGRADSMDSAEALARTMWKARTVERLGAAA